MRTNSYPIQFYCFLTLIFWLPIPLGSNRPWAWGIIEIVSFLLLAVHFIMAVKDNNNVLKKLSPYKYLLIPFAAVQLWVLFQIIPLPSNILYSLSPNLLDIYSFFPEYARTLSVDPSETRVSLYKGVAYFAIMLLSILLIDSEKRIKKLIIVMVLSGSFQAVYGSLQAMSGNNLSWVVEVKNSAIATGSFIYKNHFANFLLLTLSMGIGLLVASLSQQQFSSAKERLRSIVSALIHGKAALRIALALMVIALVMSRSRMGNAAFFIAMTITGIFAFIYFKKRTKSLSVLLISLFVIDTFILGAWFGLDKVKNRMAQTSLSQETRDEVNIYGLELIKKFAVTGTGAGSFYTVFPMVKGDDINLFYDHAHNDYLQFTIEFGIPASMTLAFIVLASLWQSASAMRKRKHQLMKGIAFGCMMAILGMLIHITVDFNLQAPANAVYFVIILTLSWQTNILFRQKKQSAK